MSNPDWCPHTVNKKVFMGCELSGEWGQRTESSRGLRATYCLFSHKNQAICSAAYTGKSGDCAKAIAEGIACMGTSNKSNNKCRAACESRSSTRFCSRPADCSGKSPKSYCTPVYKEISTIVLRACPKKNNSCDSECNANNGKICCSFTPGLPNFPTRYTCTDLEDLKGQNEKDGVYRDNDGNITRCERFGA